MLLLTLRETYALNRLSRFKNLRRKGGKFDHRPGRPKVLLRHWAEERVIAQCTHCRRRRVQSRLQQLYKRRAYTAASLLSSSSDLVSHLYKRRLKACAQQQHIANHRRSVNGP